MIIAALPDGVRSTRDFHVALDARQRYGVDAGIVGLRGRLLIVDARTAEQLAARINDARDARRFPESGVAGAEILAAALLDEAAHLMLEAYRRERDAAWSARLDSHLTERLGPERVTAARLAFVNAFPPVGVMRGDSSAAGWLATEIDGLPAREVALEERIAVRLANENPALERIRELVDDARLGADDEALASIIERRLEAMPGLPGADGDDLWALLRAPMRVSPTSLEGQLDYVRRVWGARLGERFSELLERLTRSLDMLRELRAGGPPGPPGPAPVLDRAALTRGRDEPEAYSPDADWMPSVVLVAKNAYVWLDQIARWTGRHVHRLDQVPDDALADLRANGFSGLWLIGLWQRSEASARIKRLRGQEDAVASAYSLYDYRIADDLGGDHAWRELRDRAARFGIRLAADMVPNHVGIDGRWVVEHPDWFLSLDHPPFPGYTFAGPDLSGHDAIEVRIEDGYWKSRDAAVVFERTDSASGEQRYIYHGNDGTSMPWNDTAQIDYLNPEAREAVVQVILEVARKFPIIRFDAAMTLAKQHVQRLWYPEPGHGGAIPSRSAYGALANEEFDRRMPVEFWREVVDRVAAEAPDTLLLAEAFWMMEGYFVRSLGMHRVYNSAFMNMLQREANEDYQQLVRNVLAFDPQILARFVNFMNNPDEETAIAQFGDGDKAYGVATMMATLPGLPMFGHGQVEGLHEKYGMEYRRARLDEWPEERMVARHRAEVAPLLARRHAFAGTDRFRLLEVDGDDGPLHDVFAYLNGEPDGGANLVLYHNRYASAHGRIVRTAPFATGDGETRQQGFAEALGLLGGADRFVGYRDLLEGCERIERSDAWIEHGFPVRLDAYQRRVLVDVREFRDPDGRWGRLHDDLAGSGVDDLDEALRDLELRPLHDGFASLVRGALSETNVGEPGRAVATGDAADVTVADEASDQASAGKGRKQDRARLEGFRRVARSFDETVQLSIDAVRERLARVPDPAPPPGAEWLRAWAVAAGFEHPAADARRLRFDAAVARRLELDDAAGVGPDAWAALWLALLPVTREEPSAEAKAAPSPSAALVAAEALAGLDRAGPIRTVLGVHEHEGVRWFRREGFGAWLAAWLAVRQLNGVETGEPSELEAVLRAAEQASGYRFDDLVSGPGGASAAPLS